MPRSRGSRAILYLALACLWSIALLVAALVVPIYGAATLVDENGRGVLLVVAVPALISALVWLALWHKCARGGRAGARVAWVCVGLLGAFCLIGALSIGIYVVPAAVLLARAAALTPSGPPPLPPRRGLPSA